MSYLDKSCLLTVEEVSKLLRLSILTIYKYIRERKLEAIAFGGHYRIEQKSLNKFIDTHKTCSNLNFGKDKSYEE
jgi:excisionase family DNA binding protein